MTVKNQIKINPTASHQSSQAANGYQQPFYQELRIKNYEIRYYKRRYIGLFCGVILLLIIVKEHEKVEKGSST